MTELLVALVGPDHQENLALEYLAAAVERAGHRAAVVAFNDGREAGTVAAGILRMRPDVIGLSIAFQAYLGDSLALAQELRRAGYRGHLTCGGHVPSFEYRELLRECPAFDTVVRHDGELTLVELLGRLERGESLAGLAGVVWREGDTARVEAARRPVADLDQLAPPLRPDEPRRFAGIPTGYAIASRGCSGECSYCCIRGLSRDGGGARYRLRSPEAVAQEVARLFRHQQVKVVFLQDDLFILPNQERAAERMRSLARCLSEAGVSRRAFWIKGRPDSVSPPVLDAAQELGVIHLFLGVENHAPDRLAYLGRRHGPADNERALALLAERGLGVSFNLMLFDPESTLEDVYVNLDFAAAHLDLPWNVCRTELYSGTELLQRVAAQGRLIGDYRGYGYSMRDPRAEIMFRILRVCFRQRAFEATSLLNQVISLRFAHQLHQRLIPGLESDRAAEAIGKLAVEVHQDTVDTLRWVADFAASASVEDAARVRRHAVELGFEINQRDLAWRRQAEHWALALDLRGRAWSGKLGGESTDPIRVP